MAVVIETTLGDITVDLYLEQRPATCLNFLKLCKMKYYNFNLFHTIRSGFIAQTGDPTGEGSGGESIWGLLEGSEKRFFSGEKMPKIRHTDAGLLSMVCTDNMMVGSQFFFTLAPDLDSLDGVHCVIGEVTEGHEVLTKLNEVICDETHRPYQDVRITHTVVLEDPFNDLPGLRAPSRSPSPNAERLKGGRIAPDEEIDETQGKSHEEIQEMIEEKEAKARATILEIVGDLPDADIAPPENVLFVCKLNPVTTDDDLEIIFSRFGKIVSCEVIRDKKTGDSLQYAFIEFENKESCEDAYFKMDNVLIDDRRIHVDFSQSVSKMRWLGKGRGVQYFNDKESKPELPNNRSKRSSSRERNDSRQHSRDGQNRERVRGNRVRDGENRDRDRENRERNRENRDRYKEDRDRNKEDRENRERDGGNRKKDRENREKDKQNTDRERENRGRDRENTDRDRENRERDRENREKDTRYRNIVKSNDSERERSRSRSRIISKSESKSNHTRNNKNILREDIKDSQDHSHANKNERRADNNHYDKQGIHKNVTRENSSSSEREQKNSDNHKKHKRDRSKDRHSNISHKTSKRDASFESHHKELKHSNHSSRSKEQIENSRSSKGAREVAAHTPSPVVNEKNSKSKKSELAKTQKKVKSKLRKNKKKRKPSTSSSESETSDSSSTSSSESSSSSEGHKKKRLSKRRKRRHSSSSSSSSSSTSSSDSSSTSSSSSSDSSGSTSESDHDRKKRKKSGNKKSGKKTKKL